MLTKFKMLKTKHYHILIRRRTAVLVTDPSNTTPLQTITRGQVESTVESTVPGFANVWNNDPKVLLELNVCVICKKPQLCLKRVREQNKVPLQYESNDLGISLENKTLVTRPQYDIYRSICMCSFNWLSPFLKKMLPHIRHRSDQVRSETRQRIADFTDVVLFLHL